MKIVGRLWNFLARPGVYPLGAVILFGMAFGIMFWGGFNWAMELSNTEAFCITCHEMESTVYQESKEKTHYSNKSGVRATCADCHVPREWGPKVVRKVYATRELYYKIIGSVNTKEKFEAKRLELAQRVWDSMKANDSRECRNCHNMTAMNLEEQKPRARAQHLSAIEDKETCIDCHKGLAHKAVHDQLEKTESAEEDFVF